jgi:hypothetical protein
MYLKPKTAYTLSWSKVLRNDSNFEVERCIPKPEQWRFLKFGSLEGVIHPKDAKWQRSITNHVTTKQMPPKEHFAFTTEQQNAINILVRQLSKQPAFKNRLAGR